MCSALKSPPNCWAGAERAGRRRPHRQAGDVIAQMDPRDYEAQLQGVQAMRQRAAPGHGAGPGRGQRAAHQDRCGADGVGQRLGNAQAGAGVGFEVRKRQAQRDGEQNGVRIASAAVGEAQAAKEEAEAGHQAPHPGHCRPHLEGPCWGRIEYRVVEPGSVIPQAVAWPPCSTPPTST